MMLSREQVELIAARMYAVILREDARVLLVYDAAQRAKVEALEQANVTVRQLSDAHWESYKAACALVEQRCAEREHALGQLQARDAKIAALEQERDKFKLSTEHLIHDTCEIEKDIEALGIPLTDDYGALYVGEEVKKALQARDARVAQLEAALRDIAEGRGAYSRDPFQHCINCLENAKNQARQALTPSTGA